MFVSSTLFGSRDSVSSDEDESFPRLAFLMSKLSAETRWALAIESPSFPLSADTVSCFLYSTGSFLVDFDEIVVEGFSSGFSSDFNVTLL